MDDETRKSDDDSFPSRPASIARESDPRVLAEILGAVARLGPCTTQQLSSALRERIGVRISPTERGGEQRGTKLAVDKARTIKREFEFLGWIEPSREVWELTSTGRQVASQAIAESPAQFARQLCVANDSYNSRVVSRLLARMWDANRPGQGAAIIPALKATNYPEHIEQVRSWISLAIASWYEVIRNQMPGVGSTVTSEEMSNDIVVKLATNWSKYSKSQRRNRLQETVAERFAEWIFGDIVSASDVEIWQSRMDWAGLTLTARDLQNAAGRVWFPVGAFREYGSDDFTAIEGLRYRDRVYYCYTPMSHEFQQQFAAALYEGYLRKRRTEQAEYISLLDVRDWVAYQLRIGNPHFERSLQETFSRALRGEIPYSMALEVDITPEQRNRIRGVVPVLIDGSPRYIIAMRHT